MLTSLPKPQDGVTANISLPPQIKKGTLNCEAAEYAFHEMLQALAPSLDSVYNV